MTGFSRAFSSLALTSTITTYVTDPVTGLVRREPRLRHADSHNRRPRFTPVSYMGDATGVASAQNLHSGRLEWRPMKPLLVILASVLATALGVAAIVLGEADDSPGLQGLGVLLVVGAIALGVRTAKRRSEDRQDPSTG